MIQTRRVQVDTSGGNEMQDLTRMVQGVVADSGLTAGIVVIFVAHSTAGVTVSEFEPGLIEDIRQTLERIAPADADYRHNALNRDDNAHSHLRSSVIGPSLTVPFESGRLALGTWQRVVLIDFDTHPRTRQVVIQVIGE